MAHPFRCLLRLAPCALAALAACSTGQAREPLQARRVHVIQGFSFPESVRYDPGQDVFFVSNMHGPGSTKDGDAYIARVPAGDLGRVEVFIRGGANGVTLNAPKGMALQGDTLWVTDIDVLRAFDRRTGAPLAAIDLAPQKAVLLNDVAVGPDGTLRVTDTGIAMTSKGVIYQGGDKIFVIGAGNAVSVMAMGAALGRPNGITYDPQNSRWIVVTFDPFRSEVYALRQGDTARTVLGHGAGKFDGVERLADGRLLVTSWSDSALHVFSGGKSQRVITGLWQPADLGVDTRRDRVAIPLVLQGRVEIWDLPPGAGA